jgi:hypothetical protein
MSRSFQLVVCKAAGYAALLLPLAALILAVLALPTPAAAESTINCPAGTYDMLDWMTLDSDLRSTYHLEGTSNPLYTLVESDKFYWVKGGLGYPWDIQQLSCGELIRGRLRDDLT